MDKRKLMVPVLTLLLIVLPLLGACGEKEVVKEVIKEVPVEKEVVKEVVKEVPVEKEVVKEVEKEVVKEVVKEVPAELGDPVRIGFELGLTGPYASVHKIILQGMQDYVRHVNESGGLQDTDGVRHMVEMRVGDMGGQVPKSISLYEKAKQDGVLFYGTAWVNATDALKPRFDKDMLPTACMSSSHSAIVPDGYGIIHDPYYEDYICAYAKWFKETQWDKPEPPKLAFFALNNAFGRIVFKDEVTKYIEEEIGVEIVAQEVVDYIPVDTTPNLTKIKAAGADFIWAQVVGVTAAPILRDMTKLEMDLPIAGPSPASIVELIELAGENAEGWITASVSPFVEDDPDMERVKELQRKYRGQVFADDLYTSFGFAGVVVQIGAVEAAMKEIPFSELTGENIMKYGLNSLENYDVWVHPPVTYTNGWRYGQNNVRMVQVQNGVPAFASDWIECPDVLGYSDYYEKEIAPQYK